MKRPFKLFSLGIILLSTRAFAHDEFNNTFLSVKPYSSVPGYDLIFKGIDSGQKITWTPNAASISGVQVSIKDLIGFGFSTTNPIPEDTVQARGKTTFSDLRFTFAYKEFTFRTNYTTHHGFYQKESLTESAAHKISTATVIAPDLKARNITTDFFYVRHPDKFSMPAALDQTERQGQSGGSWLWGFSFADQSFDNANQSIIPAARAADFGSNAAISYGNFRSLTARLAYGYTIAFTQKIFLSVLGGFGSGIQDAYYRESSEHSTHTTQSVTKWDIIASLGYNGDRFFSGFTVIDDAVAYKLKSLDINSTLYSATLFLGFRL